MPPIRRSVLVAAVIAIVLVAAGMWLVVAGWPMETPAQIAMLDLGQLPMSAAVLVAIAEMTYQRRLWLRRPARFAAVFGPGAVLFLAGVVMFVIAFALPARQLAGGAQLLIWTGLGIAFGYLAVDSVRRELRSSDTRLAPVDDEEDLDALWPDETDDEYGDEEVEDLDENEPYDPLRSHGSYGSYRAPRLLPEATPPAPPAGSSPGADPPRLA